MNSTHNNLIMKKMLFIFALVFCGMTSYAQDKCNYIDFGLYTVQYNREMVEHCYEDDGFLFTVERISGGYRLVQSGLLGEIHNKINFAADVRYRGYEEINEDYIYVGTAELTNFGSTWKGKVLVKTKKKLSSYLQGRDVPWEERRQRTLIPISETIFCYFVNMRNEYNEFSQPIVNTIGIYPCLSVSEKEVQEIKQQLESENRNAYIARAQYEQRLKDMQNVYAKAVSSSECQMMCDSLVRLCEPKLIESHFKGLRSSIVSGFGGLIWAKSDKFEKEYLNAEVNVSSVIMIDSLERVRPVYISAEQDSWNRGRLNDTIWFSVPETSLQQLKEKSVTEMLGAKLSFHNGNTYAFRRYYYIDNDNPLVKYTECTGGTFVVKVTKKGVKYYGTKKNGESGFQYDPGKIPLEAQQWCKTGIEQPGRYIIGLIVIDNKMICRVIEKV